MMRASLLSADRRRRHAMTWDGMWKSLLAAAFLISVVGNVLSAVPVTAWPTTKPTVSPVGWYRTGVEMYKIRNCRYLQGSEQGWAQVDGEWYNVKFNFLANVAPSDDGNMESSWRYRQDFGTWQWAMPSEPGTIDAFHTTVLHDCAGTLRVTIIGPFPYHARSTPLRHPVDGDDPSSTGPGMRAR